MRFAAIDVETANPDMASICQIGVATFTDGLLSADWQILVNPEDHFDDINSSIHGIEEHHVQNAPTFPAISDELFAILRNQPVIAHTHFDRAAISQACRKNDLASPELQWLDSARVARRAWAQFATKGYGLKNLCKYIGYSFRHHDALEDAKAAGQVMLAAMKETNLSLDDWFIRVALPIDPKKLGLIARKGNPDGDLYGEVIVFTGALEIPRREAAKMAATVGCSVTSSVTKKTTLLVVGDQDVTKLAGHSKSTKQRKAEQLMAKGQEIRILRESDFQQIVDGL
jgi:DNA polymerase-3 subunit epsilon